MSAGTTCCNACFNFDMTGKENVKFYAKDGTMILVTYTKNGSVYEAISFDCGQKFQEHKKIMDVQGNLKEIKVLAKNNKFVVAIIESVSNQDIARVVAGSIDPNEQRFTSRECTKQEGRREGPGRIIDVSLGFRPYQLENQDSSAAEESCDSVFFMNELGQICIRCYGHG